MLAPQAPWVNPCGGRSWRATDDGGIEVDGFGVMLHEPGSSGQKTVEQTYLNWDDAFHAAADKYGVPVSWLVAIASNETGFLSASPDRQRTVSRTEPSGVMSVGIMQPLTGTAAALGFDPTQLVDPFVNISVAAAFFLNPSMGGKALGYGFPAVAATYNAGRICNVGNDMFNTAGHKGQYVTNAIKFLNTAVAMGLGVEGTADAAIGATFWLVGIGVAVAIHLYTR